MLRLQRIILPGLVLFAMIGLLGLPVIADDIVLSNNSGESSTLWFITGEASLVINGFDLAPLGVELPAVINSISLSVSQPAPGVTIDAVVYQDSNGGSPVDAVLAAQTRVEIAESGVFTATFNPPVIISAPVVWLGFYLPVDFEFRADESGSSVLTYWAWTAGGTFDLSNLSSAAVLGPANGSAPVSLDMGGVARITGVITGDTTTGEQAAIIGQLIDTAQTDLSPLRNYEFCGPVFYDQEDVSISNREAIQLHCRVSYDPFAPQSPAGYERRGFFFEVFAFGNMRGPEWFNAAVTHCIKPQAGDLETAILAVAHGTPRRWQLLPTVRFGEMVCAEMINTGFLSYFVPVVTTGSEAQPEGQ